MALCLLAALWKRENKAANDSSGFVDGILAIVVDHALRAESGDEAILVRSRVAKMGVRCEIVQCDWSDGRPKLGHLQEAARDKRYELLQKVSLQHQIGVLLIAHHADDQLRIDKLLEEEGVGSGLEKVVFTNGVDKEGHPVCYNAYGELQDKELYQNAFAAAEKYSKFLRWRIQFLESSVRKLDFSPDGISTIVQVNDLKNSPGLFLFKKELTQATNQAFQLLQDNYPEFVAKQRNEVLIWLEGFSLE